jgi:FMN reductase [NAD(P)H]
MSNPVIDQLTQRRSVRAFTGEPVRDDDLTTILKATQQAPNSINGQQISLVVIRDKQRIARVAEIAGGQPQVADANVVVVFVVDYNRAAEAARIAGTEQVVERSAEGILAGAVDAGIALATFQTAANSLGYGSTAIGGIRRNPREMIDFLGLPPRTYPIVAATLGVPDPDKLAQAKPRVALETFALPERYDVAKVTEGVAAYDQELRSWWDAQGLTQMPTYSADTAKTYSTVYFPTIAATLRSQGFEFADEA